MKKFGVPRFQGGDPATQPLLQYVDLENHMNVLSYPEIMASRKKSAAKKYDMVIKAKGTSSRILEIGQGIVRMESASKGKASGRYYSGNHWDTVEATMQMDGTAQLNVKYIHMTNKGETIVGTGTAVQQPANPKGVAKFTGEGTMWTTAPRLSQLNGARWTCEGDYDMIRETVEVRGTFNMHTGTG